MTAQFQFKCGSERRRQMVADVNSKLNGIDYLEVDAANLQLNVHFFHFLPGTPQNPGVPLGIANIAIDGGVRVHPAVTQVTTAGKLLTITVDQLGDFSTYRLRLRQSDLPDAETPQGFDPPVSQVDFSFRLDCDPGLDCATPVECAPMILDEPEIDYQARDYASFRRLMLDRLSAITPAWTERNPADFGIAMVELFAYLGDQLTYQQDAVATEAYLSSARRRVSVRRHARLLDYRMHDGCNARAWVHFDVSPAGPDVKLPALSLLLSGGSFGPAVDPTKVDIQALLTREQPVVFQTMHDATLRESQNRIRFYTWTDFDCCLPAGATAATLREDTPLHLAVGDVLIFEEVLDPAEGVTAGADPAHRHAVRLTRADSRVDVEAGVNVVEIEWAAEDALPFPLCLSVTLEAKAVEDVSVALGNIVLADHGRWLPPFPVDPPSPPVVGRYRPRLGLGPVTFVGPSPDLTQPAVAAMTWDSREATPAIKLSDGHQKWNAQPDLLESGQFATDYVAEVESDGVTTLRFGDGVHGLEPDPDLTFVAGYRVGNGIAGNLGREAISRVVIAGGGLSHVTNPLPAQGGVEPEEAERVKLMAPHAFRTQLRAVTESDYAEVTQRRQEVHKAGAQFRWTGSWYTSFVTVEPHESLDLPPPEKAALAGYLDRFRMAGWDVEIEPPVSVPLDVALTVCVAVGYLAGHVKVALAAALGSGRLPDGTRGFFNAENFQFGQPLFLSALYQAALGVHGVKSVVVDRLERLGAPSAEAIDKGELIVGRFEVIRCDNDPNFPDRGRLSLAMVGGA